MTDKEDHKKEEATILTNLLKELKPLDKDAQKRLLKAIAAFFELDTPSFQPPRPPRRWGGGGGAIKYGTPFP